MHNKYVLSIVAALLLMSLIAACAGAPAATRVAGVQATKAPEPAPAQKDYETLNPANFSTPTKIDHKWYPFVPGTQFVYDGQTKDGSEVKAHRVVVTVTDLTKVIEGVKTRVNFIYDFSENQVVEAELAFFAQDNDGNVWRMGEHPESYEDGQLVDAPTWISGIADAHAGIAMRAKPDLGTPSYSQGWGPGVGFSDRGQVVEAGLQVCTPLDCFENVIKIRESSLTEQGVYQFKYYAPGKYNIRVDFQGANQKQEILELVEIATLDAQGLADMRQKALDLEKHAYEISPDVYSKTPPIEQETASTSEVSQSH